MQKLFAKKSLGQHFLHSPSALKKIIEAAAIKSDETVLEIGPGTGILTSELLKTGAHVIAIEKDDRAIALLEEKFGKEYTKGEKGSLSGKLTLIHGDILDFGKTEGTSSIDIETTKGSSATKFLMSRDVISRKSRDTHLKEGDYALVANIPYYITGAILRKFLENSPRPNRMILLVQKEVAERMVGRETNQGKRSSGQGKPGPKKESLLSISVKAFGTPRIVGIVPKGAFVPPPTVDSAIIAIENISDKNFSKNNKNYPKNSQYFINNSNSVDLLQNGSISRFFDILHAGFAHKRKVLIRNLEDVKRSTVSDLPDRIVLQNIWKKLGLSEKIRAEDITLGQWLQIFHEYTACE